MNPLPPKPSFSDFSSSSDEEDDVLVAMHKSNTALALQLLENGGYPRHGGSVKGRAYICRERYSGQGHEVLFREFFAKSPVYPPKEFRRRFRMRRELFNHVLAAVEEHDPYFVQKTNAAGKLGFSPLQKMTAAMMVLMYGMKTSEVDNYVKIGESTTVESLKRFCKTVIKVFGDEYLRAPTEADITRLLSVGQKRGFPGMLGSLDCFQWIWEKCPPAWHSVNGGNVGRPHIVLEAVASYDLWIWHACFGMAGSHSDLHILDRSYLFSQADERRVPEAKYTVNGHNYNKGYYLSDDIYPRWANTVHTVRGPDGVKKQFFATMQEAMQKDVERAFGVLQSRFAVVRGPIRYWKPEILGMILTTCIILHNMIIEDERDDTKLEFDYDLKEYSRPVTVSRERTVNLCAYVGRHPPAHDETAHHTLRNDLIEHLWQGFGQTE